MAGETRCPKCDHASDYDCGMSDCRCLGPKPQGWRCGFPFKSEGQTHLCTQPALHIPRGAHSAPRDPAPVEQATGDGAPVRGEFGSALAYFDEQTLRDLRLGRVDRVSPHDAQRLADALSALRAEHEALRSTMREAIDFAAEGWGYASDYFRDKWMYEERIASAQKPHGRAAWTFPFSRTWFVDLSVMPRAARAVEGRE